MKISARNQLHGTIAEVHEGATTAHVEIEVGGAKLTASITNEAVDELKLKKAESLRSHQGVRCDDRDRLMGADNDSYRRVAPL